MQVINNTQISVTTFADVAIGDCFKNKVNMFWMKVAPRTGETANAINLGTFAMEYIAGTDEVTVVTATLTLTN
jgi:hypothetical protein